MVKNKSQYEIFFQNFISQQKLKMTNQRRCILQAALATKGYFTADELLLESQKRDKTASRATVYRLLPLLAESKLIREVDVGHDKKYYCANTQLKVFQTQIIDADTGQIHEIDAPFMEWYAQAACKQVGMSPISQRLQITGKKLPQKINAPEDAS